MINEIPGIAAAIIVILGGYQALFLTANLRRDVPCFRHLWIDAKAGWAYFAVTPAEAAVQGDRVRFPQAHQTRRPLNHHLSGTENAFERTQTKRTPAELVEMAEEYEVEGASTLRRQDLMFAILKEVAEDGEEILGHGNDRSAAGRLRPPAQPGSELPRRSRTISMFRRTRSANGACVPAIRLKARSAPLRTASAISH